MSIFNTPKNTPKNNKGGAKGKLEKPSGFNDRDFIDRREFRSWVRKQPDFQEKAWVHYPKLRPDERVSKIENNIWGSTKGKWGSLIEKDKKEVEKRKKEYEKELRTQRVQRNTKDKKTKTFEADLLDKFMGKK